MELPMVSLQTRQADGREEVWDIVRRKWIALSPEEHVRQCLVSYLIDVVKVPRGLISLEKGLKYGDRTKRYDLLVYDREGQPFVLCECKSPRVPISEETLFQASVYQSQLQGKAILLTNGRELMGMARDPQGNWRRLHLPTLGEKAGWRMDSPAFVFL
jgi:Type I restriction enzyme R protein N terminus (HSDR_N)